MAPSSPSTPPRPSSSSSTRKAAKLAQKGKGKKVRFQGGTVYWSGTTGAHEVHGAILGRYLALGGTGGRLRLPVTDEYGVPGGRRSDFQGGWVRWDAATGATTVGYL